MLSGPQHNFREAAETMAHTGSANSAESHDTTSTAIDEDYSDSVINQAATRQVGDKVFITLPGPVGAIGAIALARRRNEKA
jgi:hypothetical protein